MPDYGANPFAIHALTVCGPGDGQLALSPLPGGGSGDPTQTATVLEADIAQIIRWGADDVVSLTEADEMERLGAGLLGSELQARGVQWHHAAIRDFGTPDPEFQARWPDLSAQMRGRLSGGGRVLVHCRGGCGRSGMVMLRLLVEMGEPPDNAFRRLRARRPCAIETDGQMRWATAPL